MEKNRYISGMKVLFSTALILSTIEQSSSIASLSNVNAVDAEGFTLLHHAAAGLGSTGEVRSLVVERGANIHLRDGRGLTALHHAVLSGNVDTVNYLMFRYLKLGGAGVNVTDNSGKTPLYFAVESGNIGIIKSLIPYCENINATNSMGIPLFHYAKNLEVIKCLASFGADPNVANSRKYTTLHFAAQLGNKDVVRCLVEDLHVEVNPMSHWGRTPLDGATAHGHTEIARFLRDHGAVAGPGMSREVAAEYFEMLGLINPEAAPLIVPLQIFGELVEEAVEHQGNGVPGSTNEAERRHAAGQRVRDRARQRHRFR